MPVQMIFTYFNSHKSNFLRIDVQGNGIVFLTLGELRLIF